MNGGGADISNDRSDLDKRCNASSRAAKRANDVPKNSTNNVLEHFFIRKNLSDGEDSCTKHVLRHTLPD